MNEHATSEAMRRIDRLATVATVTQLNAAKALAKVRFGDNAESDWLPFLAAGAGAVRVWMPPTVGTQVLVICPSGDTVSGVILQALYSNDAPAPSGDAAEVKLTMPGISITMSNGIANIELTTANLKGDLIVDGHVRARTVTAYDGDMSATGDVVAQGVSLVQHTHGGIMPGGSNTAQPNQE